MIWIKIYKSEIKDRIIYLPKLIADKMLSQVVLRYGQREILVDVKVLKTKETKKMNAYQNPEEVSIADSIMKELLIEKSLVYQMKYTHNTIELGPVIGLVLGEQHYYYHNRWMKEFTDAMGIYEKIGGLFIAFKASSIVWGEKCIYGLYYNPYEKKWKYGRFPIPSVIFRRAFQKNSNLVNELKELYGCKIFNSLRLDKWQLYKKLADFDGFKGILPETKRLNNFNILLEYLDENKKAIIKPAKVSRGRGIYIITKSDKGRFSIRGHDFRNAKELKLVNISKGELESIFLEGKFLERKYIIQNLLDLAKINGDPFDIRVVMQKDEKGFWQCNGIECRLAGPEDVLTNISRGGQALPITEAIQLAFKPPVDTQIIKKDIISLAQEFCKFMDGLGEHYAEFGLDFAIDQRRNYWFIEANVRPTFKGFKIMDYKNYLHLCQAPIIYAASIAGFGRKGIDHENKN